jgi:hypothetical protein
MKHSDQNRTSRCARWLVAAGLFNFLACFPFATVDVRCAEVSPSSTSIDEGQLAKILKNYENLRTLDADFRQTKLLSEMKLKLKSSGHVHVDRARDQVVWEIRKPARMRVQIVKDAIEIESGAGDNHSVQKYQLSALPADRQTQDLGVLISWMKLEPKKLAAAYNITVPQAGNCYDFVPKSSGSAFQRMELHLDAKRNISQIKIFEKSGDELLIEFDSPRIVSGT